jgi:hypothetical protein
MSKQDVRVPSGGTPSTPAGGYWYGCSHVEPVGDKVRWQLKLSSRYSFFEAYAEKDPPHHQLIKATDDAALLDFMKTWGPLYFSWPWESEWGNTQPIEQHRMERDGLVAMTEVLASVGESDRQRHALAQWLEFLHERGTDGVMLFGVRQSLGLPGDSQSGFDKSFRDWLECATRKQIESAIVSVVALLSPVGASPHRFFVDRIGRRDVVRAELALDSLREALQWMVWQDYFQKRPYQFCEECGKVFGVRDGHKRKFCPDGLCAHRRAARESYQRKHPQVRKRKRGR